MPGDPRIPIYLLDLRCLLLLLLSGLPAQPPQLAAAEARLQEADSLWLRGALPQGCAAYADLLADPTLAAFARPLVALRLARVQGLSGRGAAGEKTLATLLERRDLSRHHRMAARRLARKLRGEPDRALARSPAPEWRKAAATIVVDGGVDSIEAALAKARALRRQARLPAGPIEILLSCEEISIRESLQLTAADSGTRRNPLVIRGALAQPTRLSGGIRLTQWHAEKDVGVLARLPAALRSRVRVADFARNSVPALPRLDLGGFSSVRAAGTSHRFKTFPVPELFYQGRPQTLARWPDSGDARSPLQGFTIERPLRWLEEPDLWLHGYWHHSWADAYEKVASIDRETRRIHLVQPTNRYGFSRCQWHAVNALCEMDQAGEWHFDAVAGKIRFLPPAGFAAESCRLSVYGPILVARGCQHLSICNVDFEYARGDGLVFSDCSDLVLVDCAIRRCSGYGLKIAGGLRHCILGCSIASMGRGGIDLRAGNRRDLRESASVVENCRISDLSRIDRTYTPALLLEGMAVAVRFCKFDRIPSSAIRLEGNDMLIELNEFTRCVWESDDQGAIDVWGNPTYRGNVIRWNHFHDNVKPDAHIVAGIRLDDAICGFSIYENVFVNTSNGRFGATQIHGGKDNHVEGNLFVDCHIAMSQTPWGAKRWRHMLATHKSISRALSDDMWQSPAWRQRYPSLSRLRTGPVDRNLFVDNRMLHVAKIFARKSPNAIAFHNVVDRREPDSRALLDLGALLPPWHKIPVQAIGPYGR